MVLNCRTRRGKRWSVKNGPQEVMVDGAVVSDVWYVDRRRREVRAYVRDASGHLYIDPVTRRPASRTFRGKRVIVRSVR